jgi:hypothetical protein
VEDILRATSKRFDLRSLAITRQEPLVGLFVQFAESFFLKFLSAGSFWLHNNGIIGDGLSTGNALHDHDK